MAGMDPILECTLRLACLLRDSEEAEAWRKAWQELGALGGRMQQAADTPTCQEAIRTRNRDQGRARPFLYPWLVEGYSGLSRTQVKGQLQGYPDIWEPYSKMQECMDTMGSVLSFLRRARPGYPQHDLVYTVPNSPWMMLGSECEVPWAYGGHTTPLPQPADAKSLGLGTSLASIWSQLAEAVNMLLVAIQADEVWHRLKKASAEILANRVLSQELAQARTRFEAELNAYSKLSLPKPIHTQKALELAEKSYSSLRPRNQAYVMAFKDHERILENIYWLLSQVVIYKVITCLTSAAPEQLQQVALNYGKDSTLTAVATSQTAFEEPGLLVHVAVEEAMGAFDGLYQIGSKTLKWHVGAQARIILTMRRHWLCPLPLLQVATGPCTNSVFVASDSRSVQDLIDHRHIVFIDKDGTEVDLRLRDWSPALDETRTMYLA